MIQNSLRRRALRVVAGLACVAGSLVAQQRPRISGPVDENVVLRLRNTRHPLAVPENDRGRVAGSLAMDRIQLHLKNSPEQQAALDQLLQDQQNPASLDYRRWLTPEQFGEQFGPAAEDLDTVTGWLRSHGFQGITVAAGRHSIEFGGTAQQVEAAFHTQIHHYVVGGKEHIANSTDIAIPSALSPLVGGLVSLHDFRSQPLHRLMGPYTDLSGGSHGLSPYDFAAIYDLTTLWNGGFDGTGQTIAIAGRTNIKMSDITTFRSTFGLAGNNTQIVLNGADPGIISSGEETEADLDVEWSGGVAKGATVKFVVSASTNVSDGVDLSAAYIVNNNLASTMSVSFGACEAQIGSDNNFYNNLWSQAAAQGISVFVAAGDSGSAGCDSAGGTTPATQGFGVNGLASTPYNVAVGGTEFMDATSPSSYWNTANDSHNASAKGYIPEMTWNESSYSGPGVASNGLWAGSGGVSILYARPSWQTGNGVPVFDPGSTSQQHRLLPDVSLTAAGHDGYLVYQEGGLYLVGGTSASSPSMAGIMTIIDQHSGGRNGNPNTKFYPLAASNPAVYHDVTSGTNEVPCEGGTPNCSALAPSTNTGVMNGYPAGAGYDLATGWGSVDANALATAWSSGTPPAPGITSLSPNPMTTSSSAQTLTISGTAFQSGASVKVGTASFSGSAVTFVNSGLLTVSVTETAAGTFGVTVTNPGGTSSNSVNLTVNAAVVAPAITSLSPNPMTTSSAAQTLTINGTAFQSGASVKVGTTSFSGSAVTFVNSGLLTVSVTETAAGTFGVTVTNPGGTSSNSVNLTVNAAVVAPAITSLSPNPMTTSSAAQTLTINGTAFQSGASVKVGTTSFSGSAVTFVNSGLMTVSVTESAAGTFAVTVTNPGGSASNSVNLTVNPAVIAPGITSLSPNPMTASSSAQTLTINGTAFQSGASVKVGTASFSGTAVRFVSSTQLTVSVTEAAAGTFAVTVTNPGGSASNSVNLTVNAPVAAPVITSLSPNPMTPSNSSQVLTINGTGFQSGLTVKVGSSTFASSQLTSFSTTKLTLRIVTGNGNATDPVQVINPGAVPSNTVNLVVHR